eukprot:scaffold5668_cov111-Isochrysis_galbana.AAC.7
MQCTCSVRREEGQLLVVTLGSRRLSSRDDDARIVFGVVFARWARVRALSIWALARFLILLSLSTGGGHTAGKWLWWVSRACTRRHCRSQAPPRHGGQRRRKARDRTGGECSSESEEEVRERKWVLLLTSWEQDRDISKKKF